MSVVTSYKAESSQRMEFVETPFICKYYSFVPFQCCNNVYNFSQTLYSVEYCNLLFV